MATLEKVMPTLRSGGFIRRKAWLDGLHILLIDREKGGHDRFEMRTLTDRAMSNWPPQVSDLLADDWEVFKLPAKVTAKAESAPKTASKSKGKPKGKGRS
jgi:hypothetical protein